MPERQIQFDSRFTQEFFKIPEKKQAVAPLDFPLPTSIATLPEFLHEDNSDGKKFKKGVAKLIEQLKIWIAQHWQEEDTLPQSNNNQEPIPIRQKLQQALNGFAALFNYNGSNPDQNKEIFTLFTKGIEKLALINQYLKKETPALRIKKDIIYELVDAFANTPKHGEAHLAFAEQELECGFVLPKEKAKLDTFLTGYSGKEFYANVKKLAEKLKQWVATTWAAEEDIQVDIPIDKINTRLQTVNAVTFLQTCIDSFITQFNNFTGTAPFPLYHEGIPLLAKITHLVQSKNTPIDTKKNIMRTLIHDMAVCAPGIHTNITNAYLQLTENIPIKLMGARRIIATQVCLELIRDLRQKNEFHDFDIRMETHYVNSELNHFASPLMIEKIVDEYATTVPATAEEAAARWANENVRLPLFKIAEAFPAAIKKSLTPDRLIDLLLQQSEIIQTIQSWPNYSPDKIDLIKNKLEAYGPEPLEFMTDSIWYWDEEANNQLGDFKQRSTVELEYNFRLMLLHRLANSGYLNLDSKQEKKIGSITCFDFPNASIKLSYVILTNSENKTVRKLLVLHIIDEFKRTYFLDEKQKDGDLTLLTNYSSQEMYPELLKELINVLRQETNEEIRLAFIKKLFTLDMAGKVFLNDAANALHSDDFYFLIKNIDEQTLQEAISPVDLVTFWQQLNIDLDNKHNKPILEKLLKPILSRLDANNALFTQICQSTTKNNNTLLHVAAALNQTPLLEKIKNAGINMINNNSRNQSPLDIAALTHAWESTAYLLDPPFSFTMNNALIQAAQENQSTLLKKINRLANTAAFAREKIKTLEPLNELLARDDSYFIESLMFIIRLFQQKQLSTSDKETIKAIIQIFKNCPPDIANKILNLKGQSHTLFMYLIKAEDFTVANTLLTTANVDTINACAKETAENRTLLDIAFYKMNHETAQAFKQKAAGNLPFKTTLTNHMAGFLTDELEGTPLILSLMANNDARVLSTLGSFLPHMNLSIAKFREEIIKMVFNKPDPDVWLVALLQFCNRDTMLKLWKLIPSHFGTKKQQASVMQAIFERFVTPNDEFFWEHNASDASFTTAIMQADAVDVMIKITDNDYFNANEADIALSAAYKNQAWRCLTELIGLHKRSNWHVPVEKMTDIVQAALEAGQWDAAITALTYWESYSKEKSTDYQLPNSNEKLTPAEEKMSLAFFKALVICNRNHIIREENRWIKLFSTLPQKMIDRLLLATQQRTHQPLLFQTMSSKLSLLFLQKGSDDAVNKLLTLPTSSEPMLHYFFRCFSERPDIMTELLEKVTPATFTANLRHKYVAKNYPSLLQLNAFQNFSAFAAFAEKAPIFLLNSNLLSQSLKVLKNQPEHIAFLKKMRDFLKQPDSCIEKNPAELMDFLLRTIPENHADITDHQEWLSILTKALNKITTLKTQYPTREFYFEILSNQLLAFIARIHFSNAKKIISETAAKEALNQARLTWKMITKTQDMRECDRLLQGNDLWDNPQTTIEQKINYLNQLHELTQQGKIKSAEQLQTRLSEILAETKTPDDEKAPATDDPELFHYVVTKLISYTSQKKWRMDLQGLSSYATLFSNKNRNDAMIKLYNELASQEKTPEEKFKMISDVLSNPILQQDNRSTELLVKLQKDLVLSSLKPKSSKL